MSISNDTFIARMLEAVGGINVFGDHEDRFPEIDMNGRIPRCPRCRLSLRVNPFLSKNSTLPSCVK